ncbi:MAG: FAD-dependent oxidoreductase [Eubacteriales bacterium]|nr:FAD-dependent oxidoreductase [Eubacteriales bacterium]
MYETAVIGSGPAGLNAALYLKRAGKDVIIIEKEYEGAGQITQSICVGNYLGFQDVSGAELGEYFRQHVFASGVPVLEDEVTGIIHKDIWQAVLASGKIIGAETLIYAAGAVPRELGIPGEKTYRGKGISYCAYCDGSLFRGKDTAVIGGGDTALDDALYLSGLCRKVYLIHRREEFRGNNAIVESLRKRKNVEFLLKTSVREVYGQGRLEGIFLDDGRKIRLNGLFVAIGSIPRSDMIKDYVQRDENGYVIAGEDGITVSPGLFVAGDVRTKKLRQVITAVSDGANAAASAIQYMKFCRKG